ncbi:chemosensory receptor c [Plakobranchus ocellatus]|uniref:Chemosensory receptor c n=1 Tax=Plakobranchus ocellatus TaxID=259542 RepID=A0AAV3ZIC9_9GAST|nr:chemosensory receptor c [Plakobranchus ocellatus]
MIISNDEASTISNSEALIVFSGEESAGNALTWKNQCLRTTPVAGTPETGEQQQDRQLIKSSKMATNSSIDTGLGEDFPPQILTDELYPYLRSLFCILSLMFSMPAVCFNAINVLIFFTIGVTDSITVCFLYLAVCDFCTMVSLSVGAFFTLFFSLGIPGSHNLATYSFGSAVVYGTFSNVASATTTYIALQRGLCVAWPFLTRHAFTRNRTFVALIAITVVLLGCGMPRAVTFRFIYVPDPSNNASQIASVHFFEIYRHFDALYLIFVKLFMGFTQYIVMSVCAVAIYIGMRSSIRLKSASSSAGSDSYSARSNQGTLEKTEKVESCIEDIGQKKTENNFTDTKTKAKQDTGKKPPQKEILVIKQALTVVVLQVMCTTPGIIVYIFAMIEPRFRMGTEYHNLYFVIFGAVDWSYAVNAFFNFFIYLNFNSKFSNCFHSVFGEGKTIDRSR